MLKQTRLLQERLQSLKSEQEQQAIAQCTFHPAVNHHSPLMGRPVSAQASTLLTVWEAGFHSAVLPHAASWS